jgi:hypothetical protein
MFAIGKGIYSGPVANFPFKQKATVVQIIELNSYGKDKITVYPGK